MQISPIASALWRVNPIDEVRRNILTQNLIINSVPELLHNILATSLTVKLLHMVIFFACLICIIIN